MQNKKTLASNAITSALKLRLQLGHPFEESISPLDAAERLGIEVRLVDFPSMEGMYVAGANPQIFLSSLRPQGRRNFTCAHEIGHHAFGHGEQFDEMNSDRSKQRKIDPKEFTANCFAAFFLMPKVTVEIGMNVRGFKYQTLTPKQIYALASWLGVGYRTLVNHMEKGLGTISSILANELKDVQPAQVREQFLGHSSQQLHVIDKHWIGRAIDCEVGDQLLMPAEMLPEGSQLEKVDGGDSHALLLARAPGIARISCSTTNWAAFVRVSPSRYAGRACFRYEEEVEE